MRSLSTTPPATPPIGRARALLVGGILFGAALFFALATYTLLRYPAIGGTSIATTAYIALAGLLSGLYAWVGLRGSRVRTTQAGVALRYGGVGGLSLGVLWFAGELFGALRLIGDEASAGLLGLAAIGLVGVGLATGLRGGRVGSGALAGFWAGLIFALAFAITEILIDDVFAGTFLRTTWATDHYCRGELDVAACEIGDTLGGVANFLLAMPLVGAGLGALGGALGSASAISRGGQPEAGNTVTGSSGWARVPVPLAFGGLATIIFVVGLVGRLW
jgi:hypothetical protein